MIFSPSLLRNFITSIFDRISFWKSQYLPLLFAVCLSAVNGLCQKGLTFQGVTAFFPRCNVCKVIGMEMSFAFAASMP